MTSQPRPVFLNSDQRRHLTQLATLADRHGFHVLMQAADEIVAAWDAAPADAAEAIANALLLLPKTPEASRAVAGSVLLVLGYPHTEQA